MKLNAAPERDYAIIACDRGGKCRRRIIWSLPLQHLPIILSRACTRPTEGTYSSIEQRRSLRRIYLCACTCLDGRADRYISLSMNNQAGIGQVTRHTRNNHARTYTRNINTCTRKRFNHANYKQFSQKIAPDCG